jgi:hypothetical protein
MRLTGKVRAGLLGLLVAAVVAGGCGKKEDEKAEPAALRGHSPARPAGGGAEESKEAKGDNKHSGWWCTEHGIPEAECSMCSARVARECKAKGDWCDKHNRALSQCFICNPKRKDFYAAKYRAKYGKEPPPIEDND